MKASDAGCQDITQALGKISYLELGDSDALYPTEPVLALGYPLGQRYLKSTVGVIAGKDYVPRLNGEDYGIGHSFIHITAPINPGNSGGPSLNKDGYVVGINSAGELKAQNVGYIIPINDAKILLKDLYSTKLLRKPVLGIDCNPTTKEHAQLLGNPLPSGVYINDIMENYTADKAQIKAGDVLYEINNHKVDEYGDVNVGWRGCQKISLAEFLVRLPLHSNLELVIYRNGERKVIKTTFDEPPLDPIRYIFSDYEQQAVEYEMFGGLCVMQLRANHFNVLRPNSVLQKYAAFDKANKQVLVITNVLPGSCLDKISCFYEGSLLDTVNGKKVENLSQLREALALSASTGYVSITTKDKISSVVSLDNILQDEERIARDFMFSVSDTVKKLNQARSEILSNTKK